jgi:hypothetical protein
MSLLMVASLAIVVSDPHPYDTCVCRQKNAVLSSFHSSDELGGKRSDLIDGIGSVLVDTNI